ncbi:MAG: flagellin FliC [Chromatiaceae bacterium]|nr:flagellin FliC [Gammaproteobacteria bacterium]MCP5301060.1 flagellin FliC [Chromatiaceae bacterium]MCP5421468.1 flagellin FliC [Chromatiaceae bacterium]
MPQVINTNMMSLNSQRALDMSQNSMQTSLERLSSGLRINRAKDDAAGLAITERMTAQIRGLEQANRNGLDGISLMQTAEGALDEVGNMLQRMRELAVQSANGTVGTADKRSLNDEFLELRDEISRVFSSAEFNGVNLLGTTATLTLQIGYRAGASFRIDVSTFNMGSRTYATGGMSFIVAKTTSRQISAASKALWMLSKLDAAIDNVTQKRADFGAKQNRIEATLRSNANTIENQSAARSRIRDADFARETANLTRSQILQQAGTAMLAQANQIPQNVLQLLG